MPDRIHSTSTGRMENENGSKMPKHLVRAHTYSVINGMDTIPNTRTHTWMWQVGEIVTHAHTQKQRRVEQRQIEFIAYSIRMWHWLHGRGFLIWLKLSLRILAGFLDFRYEFHIIDDFSHSGRNLQFPTAFTVLTNFHLSRHIFIHFHQMCHSQTSSCRSDNTKQQQISMANVYFPLRVPEWCAKGAICECAMAGWT